MKLIHISIWSLAIFLWGCTKYEAVFDKEPNSEFELPLILQLNGIDGAFDAASGTLKFSIDPSELSEFQPHVVFQEHASVYFDGQQWTNHEANELGNLELHQLYPLQFHSNGSETTLFLEFTNAPIAQVITLDEIPNEPKVLGKLRLYRPESSAPLTETYIGIEQRGRSSLELAKKSFGLETLSEKSLEALFPTSLFDIPANDHWVLDAQFRDRSRLRSKLTFDLWRDLGHRSLGSEYVELYINSSYYGVYRLGEYYSPVQLEAGPGHVLIKGNDNTSVTKFIELPEQAPNGALWADWEQVYPHPSSSLNWSTFEVLCETIVESNPSMFEQELPSQLDLDLLIDYYLMMSVCYGYDNVGNNWLFYQQSSTAPFEVLMWDLNATWGFREDGAHLPANLQIDNQLFTRLLELNPQDFRAQIKSRWATLRAGTFSHSALMARVDSNVQQLVSFQAYSKENQTWDLHVNSTVERNYIYKWLNERLEYLDGYFEEMEG